MTIRSQIVRLAYSFLAKLPITLRVRLGRTLGRLFSLFPTRDRKVAELQLQAFLPERDPSQVIPEVFANIGQTILESLNLKPYLDAPNDFIDCPDLEVVQDLLSRSRPLLALTAHLSNWDLLAAYMISQGAQICTVGRKARSPELQSLLEAIRNRYGIETIWRPDPSANRRLIERLEQHFVLAALIDQDTRVKSKQIEFFGAPAATPSSLVALARRHNAIIATAFIVRTPNMRFLIRVAEIDPDLSESEVLSTYSRRLEEMIREYPGQWVWFHKRWRTIDSERLSSRDYMKSLEERIANAQT